jgi:hypothetical protein
MTSNDRGTSNPPVRTDIDTVPPKQSNPKRPVKVRLPEVEGTPVYGGAVQSNWQDYGRTSTAVIAKPEVQGGPTAATYSVAGDRDKATAPKREGKREGEPENPTSTRPAGSSGRSGGWMYRNPTD